MDRDRRKSERTRCRFRCTLTSGGRSIAGTAVDLSEGGLAVRAAGPLAQGDAVEVVLEVPGHGALQLEALVWHVRQARNRETGELVSLLGLMLAKAPDAYLDLTVRPRRRGRRTPPPEPKRTPAEATPMAEVVDLSPFRVRLKHRASPRTRVVCVDAASQVEARQIARAELGDEWDVLEARAQAG